MLFSVNAFRANTSASRHNKIINLFCVTHATDLVFAAQGNIIERVSQYRVVEDEGKLCHLYVSKKRLRYKHLHHKKSILEGVYIC